MNNNFLKIFHKSGLSMYTVAAKTAIPYTTINKLCHEKLNINHISAEALYKIAVLFKVDMKELMNDFGLMEGAEGCYGKIKYTWHSIPGKNAHIAFCHNGKQIDLDMEYPFTKGIDRNVYDTFAEFAIKNYL